MPKKKTEDKVRVAKQAPTERMHRSEIRSAPYNPRILSAPAARKLRKSLQKHGVVSNPTWNKRTGTLVGGHQRLMLLDHEMGTGDYYLDVSVVDVDEKTEREMNVALNSEFAQADWSAEALLKLVEETAGFDFESAAMDPVALESIAYDAGLPTALLDSMFDPQGLEEIHEASDEIDQLLDESDDIRKEEQGRSKDGDEEGAEPQEAEDAQSQEDEVALIKERKGQFKERASYENDAGFYVTLFFSSFDVKRDFLDKIGVKSGDLVDGLEFAELAGIPLDIPKPDEG